MKRTQETLITQFQKPAECILTEEEKRILAGKAADKEHQMRLLQSQIDEYKSQAKILQEQVTLCEHEMSHFLTSYKLGSEVRDVDHELILLVDQDLVVERRKDTGIESSAREPTIQEWSKIKEALQEKFPAFQTSK